VSASLSVRGLEAGYRGMPVVHGVDLEIVAGSLTVLVGPNGAGKTTMLRSLSGLLAHTGEARLDGAPLPASPAAIVSRGLSHVPEGRELFPHMTVQETLELGAWRLPPRQRAARLEEIGALFPKLVERRQQLAGSMSGGEQQLLAIARALMGRPRVLMLDEPSLGLAPRMVDQVLAVVRRFHEQGGTVLLVEQTVAKALALADHAYVLERGRVVLNGPAREVRESDVLRGAYLGVPRPGSV
jgi:branched-chain amino acid transport system ATP-binding protein